MSYLPVRPPPNFDLAETQNQQDLPGFEFLKPLPTWKITNSEIQCMNSFSNSSISPMTFPIDRCRKDSAG